MSICRLNSCYHLPHDFKLYFPGIEVQRLPLVVGALDRVLDVVGVPVAVPVDVLVRVGAGVVRGWGRGRGGRRRRGEGEEGNKGLKWWYILNFR